MNDLKPCLFCGRDPITRVRVIEHNSFSRSTIEFSVMCERCKCGIEKRSIVGLHGTDFSTLTNVMQTLTDEWNRRDSSE